MTEEKKKDIVCLLCKEDIINNKKYCKTCKRLYHKNCIKKLLKRQNHCPCGVRWNYEVDTHYHDEEEPEFNDGVPYYLSDYTTDSDEEVPNEQENIK